MRRQTKPEAFFNILLMNVAMGILHIDITDKFCMSQHIDAISMISPRGRRTMPMMHRGQQEMFDIVANSLATAD